MLPVMAGTAYATPASDGQITDGMATDMLPGRWLDDGHFNQTLPTEDGWWKRFNDPLLDSLIELGERNNYDVLMATRRMEIARLSMLDARTGYFPTISLDARWTKSRTSGAMISPAASPATDSYFTLGVNMNWQIDLFGRIASQTKARKASWQASRADHAATMVTLCGNIATAYVNLRVYQAERAVAVAHLASQEKVVKITEARFDCGLASMLDVQQARTVYASTEATVPALEQSIHAAVNSLAVMLAVPPAEAFAMLDDPRPLPPYLQMVQTGIPMDLLRRRPDLVEAEKNIDACAAELGIAKKDYLPILSIDASIGTSAHSAGDLFTSDSFTYSVAPTLSWTLFDGLHRKYNVASARENLEVAIQNYNLVLMQALTEADNAMVSYLHTLRKIDRLDEAATASGKSLDLSLDLYKRGLAAFTNVVDAQLNYLTYTNSVIVARGEALTDLINLYEALGGGWEGL